MTKILAHFSSYYRVWKTNLKEQLKKVHKLFLPKLYSLPEQFFKTQEVVEITNFWKKKAIFPVNIKISASFFCRNIQCHKPQKTNCKGPTGTATITREVIRSFF